MGLSLEILIFLLSFILIRLFTHFAAFNNIV